MKYSDAPTHEHASIPICVTPSQALHQPRLRVSDNGRGGQEHRGRPHGGLAAPGHQVVLSGRSEHTPAHEDQNHESGACPRRTRRWFGVRTTQLGAGVGL